MKVDNIGINKVVNLYKTNSRQIEKSSVSISKDTIELSSLGKSLSLYNGEQDMVNSKEKILRLQKEISDGTYKPISKLVAQSIIDNMKGRRL